MLRVLPLERGTPGIQAQVWLAPAPRLYLGLRQGPEHRPAWAAGEQQLLVQVKGAAADPGGPKPSLAARTLWGGIPATPPWLKRAAQ